MKESSTKSTAKNEVKKSASKTAKAKKSPAKQKVVAPKATAGDQLDFKVRVRMYRHGLGDCHLLTFPRPGEDPFQMLIDFGALNRDAKQMTKFAEEIELTTKTSGGKSRLDVVAVTHEHKDHLSGFNQARAVFDRMDIGGVWMGWTENPTDDEALELGGTLEETAAGLKAALASPRFAGAAAGADPLGNVRSILAFTGGDDTGVVGKKTIADAMDYLRGRGQSAGKLKYFEPGTGPLELDGVKGIRVYVLGPPRDRDLLLGSEVTKGMQEDGTVYHLRRGGLSQLAANQAALVLPVVGQETDPYQPFAAEHRIARGSRWWNSCSGFVAQTYDNPAEAWRQIDNDWLGSFDQLALKLDNDTNNTSLVLAFEIVETGEVLLFVGDAQVGNWRSWANVKFDLPEGSRKLPAHDLLRRTVFYKVGHHSSHNATLKKGGLELMQSPKLVGFIPLDKETAAMQGRKNPETGIPKGWQMPAKALYAALKERTGKRLVISDVKEKLSPEAAAAGVIETDSYVEFKI